MPHKRRSGHLSCQAAMQHCSHHVSSHSKNRPLDASHTGSGHLGSLDCHASRESSRKPLTLWHHTVFCGLLVDMQVHGKLLATGCA